MTYRKTGQTSALPMSLEDAKRKLQIETVDLDAEAAEEIDNNVSEAIAAAAEFIEDQTKFTLRPSTFVLTLDRWPCFPLAIEKAPLREVVAIRYLDEDKVQQTLPPADWYSVQTATGGLIYRDPAATLPALANRAAAVEIELDAGFDVPGQTGATVVLEQPQRIRQALSLLTGHYYNNRDAVTDGRTYEVEMGANTLLDTVRLFK